MSLLGRVSQDMSLAGGIRSRVAAGSARLAALVLAGSAGLAVVGYLVSNWTETPPSRAGFSALSPAKRGQAGSPTAGSRTRSLNSAEVASAPRDDPALSEFAKGLVLTGIASGGRAAIAIIGGADGRESAYRIGDSIRPGVMLEEVFRNGAVVSRGGLRERLPLMRGKSTQVAYGAVEAVSASAVARPSQGIGFGRRSPFHRRNVPPDVRKQGAIVPDPDGGVQIKKLDPDSRYASMGLRAGDVLRSVNGQPVESPEELLLLYRQLSAGLRGQVDVVREGRSQTLYYGGS